MKNKKIGKMEKEKYNSLLEKERQKIQSLEKLEDLLRKDENKDLRGVAIATVQELRSANALGKINSLVEALIYKNENKLDNSIEKSRERHCKLIRELTASTMLNAMYTMKEQPRRKWGSILADWWEYSLELFLQRVPKEKKPLLFDRLLTNENDIGD